MGRYCSHRALSGLVLIIVPVFADCSSSDSAEIEMDHVGSSDSYPRFERPTVITQAGTPGLGILSI